MNTQIPYNIVLFPRLDSKTESQIASVDLANNVSRIGTSEIYTVEVMNFEYDYAIFLEDKTFEDAQKNESFFIDLFKNKIFKPGVVTFVANFDMNDLTLMMENFQIHKPDLKALLVITEKESSKWNMAERPDGVDCCLHNGAPNKGMMERLGMIAKSH